MSEPVSSSIRIGNDERTSATEALDTHLREGRLDADEYGERYARATSARTQAELTALFTDLPQPHPKLPGYRAPRTEKMGQPDRSRRWFVGVPMWVLIVGAIVVVSAIGAPWLFGGIFFWVFVLPWLFGGKRGFGMCGGNRQHFRSYSQSTYEYPKAGTRS